MSLIVNRRDLDFMLFELLDTARLCGRARYSDQSIDMYAQVLDSAEAIAEDKFASCAAITDADEPHFDGKRVHLPEETAAALETYIEAGFMGAAFDESLGGMQLPFVVAQAAATIFSAANIHIAAYPLLTVGAANLLAAYGSDEQRERYLKPMVEGRFFGTMCLSEPQAGSSLADIRTMATPVDDGTWRLRGSKMWISGGDHELSENIIHLVLAKTPDAPPGVRGISLFLVPRRLVGDDGSVGERNDVRLAGLNHKMGYRGTVNTALNFGEAKGAVGYLVGELHQGLACMFHMMNEARVGVGLGAVALGYTGYLHALDYAKNRPQGRLPAAKDPASPMVPIVEHADVRRMLLQQKAYVEGGLALCLYTAALIDEQQTLAADDGGADLALLLDLLTPIAKSWPSEFCLRANDLAIQVHGGYGYTRDYPVERLYRDNRLNPIHEGTKGIQGLDLLGRKVRMAGGRAVEVLGARVAETIAAAAGDEWLAEYAATLSAAWDDIVRTTVAMQATDSPDRYLANATVYLDAFGHTVVAWLWLRQALAARRALDDAGGERADFLKGKLTACRYFMRYELPQVHTQCELLRSLDTTCLDTPASWL
jgi:alkylation response protein AidB-like acyl-CoA dehydrogenase